MNSSLNVTSSFHNHGFKNQLVSVTYRSKKEKDNGGHKELSRYYPSARRVYKQIQIFGISLPIYDPPYDLLCEQAHASFHYT